MRYSSDTILKYLNFIYLRMRDGFDIGDNECEDTYRYYKEYCEANDLELVSFHFFYREMKKIGIKTTQYKYPDGRRSRRRNFNLLQLEKLFNIDSPLSKESSQHVTMRVGEKWFNVLIKFQEIDYEPSEVDTSNGTEEINSNNKE